MSKRFFLITYGLVLAFSATSCSAARSGVAGTVCDESPPAATLMYPQPDARNVATSLSEILVTGASLHPGTKLSLIDSGGEQIAIGPLRTATQPPNAPDGIAYESAEIKALAPEMNYIVLYSTGSCSGEADYAIGSFTTE